MGIFSKPVQQKPISYHLATAAMLYGAGVNRRLDRDKRFFGEILASIMDYWAFQTGDQNIRLMFDLSQPDLTTNRYQARYSVDEVRAAFTAISDTAPFADIRIKWHASMTETKELLPLIEALMKMGGIGNETSENEIKADRDQYVIAIILDVLGDCENKMRENTNRRGEHNQEGEDAHGRGISACAIGALLLHFYSKEKA